MKSELRLSDRGLILAVTASFKFQDGSWLKTVPTLQVSTSEFWSVESLSFRDIVLLYHSCVLMLQLAKKIMKNLSFQANQKYD